MSTSTQPSGLYRKFEVRRVDGRDAAGGDRVDARYFVLDLDNDRYARIAAAMYAAACRPEHPELADDLAALVDEVHLSELPYALTTAQLIAVFRAGMVYRSDRWNTTPPVPTDDHSLLEAARRALGLDS